jgi:signal transduction histidine kinase
VKFAPDRSLARRNNPLVRAVERLPASVHTKLLITLTGTVMLLVIVGLLGLQVLGESNRRVEQLAQLHNRVKAYRELQTYAQEMRLLLGIRGGGKDIDVYRGAQPATLTASGLVLFDASIQATLSQVGNASDTASFGFVPPPDEMTTLREVRTDFDHIKGVLDDLIALDKSGSTDAALQLESDRAEPLANDLALQSNILVDIVQAKTDRLTAMSQSSFAASEDLFIGVAIGSVMLALLLGYTLSSSLTLPIRQMGSRLSDIAAGDFSAHIDIPNRDELGVLATNINRMSDELGRLYTELAATSQHKSEFLANMSHELRTPLNAIIGFSQVLQQQMFGELNVKQVEYLDDILSSSQHLLHLINEILDVAKVEAGRMELHPSVFAVSPTFQKAVAMVRERAVRQGVAISANVDPSLKFIAADERRLNQILYNLLSNAVKFTPQGGRVELSASVVGDSVEVSVADTGIGISANDAGKIFDEFYQAKPGVAHEGTGLGLALTKRLVQLHGGEITFVSAPGEGSTFSFTLPIRQSADLELETTQQVETVTR